MSYYVYLEDTGSGDSYVIETTPNWNGPATLADGPFQTEGDAETYIADQGAPLGSVDLEANPNPANPIPGAAKTTSGFPQWGINNSGAVIEASSSSEKTSYTNEGYSLWFTSQSAAKNFASSQTGAGTGSIGIGSDISNAFDSFSSWTDGLKTIEEDVTSKALWIRAAKIIIGGGLLIIGIAHITGADNAVATAARKVPLPI